MTVTELASRRSTPAAKPSADHFVHFYERDETLVDSVAQYLREGLESGASVIVIATPDHVRQVHELWKLQGFDPRSRGHMTVLDAAETLASICGPDGPDAALFESRIAAAIEEACRCSANVVAFGEMVGLLWNEGRYDHAIRLEGFWNALGERHRFALYCAYRADGTATGAAEAFRAVCGAHAHVTPSDGVAGDETRFLSELQRRSGALHREIEARQRAEQELSDFLDNAPVAMHRVGPDGTIVWANAAELAMLGYKGDEYVGHNIQEFHADRDVFERIWDRLLLGETLRDQPAKLRCKDGSFRHVLITSNAQMREGKLSATRCFTRDVSDRWLAQEALRERGAVLHLAMQGARMGYWVGDLERGTIRGSHELAQLLGLSTAFDWKLDDFLALLHPTDRAPFRTALQAAVDGHRDFLTEFRVRTDGASWRWFEGRGEAVYDQDGHPTRFYGVVMDVSQRKRSEEQLAHWAAVVDSADDAIVSKTLDGIVKSWNGGATRIFGYEPEEIVGRPITVIIPPDLHPEEAGILARIRRGERVEHYVTTRVAKDGTLRRMSITVSPIRSASGEIIGASKIGRVVA